MTRQDSGSEPPIGRVSLLSASDTTPRPIFRKIYTYIEEEPLWYQPPYLLTVSLRNLTLYDCSDADVPKSITPPQLIGKFQMIRDNYLFVRDPDGKTLRWHRLPSLKEVSSLPDAGSFLCIEVLHKLFLVIVCELPRFVSFSFYPPPVDCEIRVYSLRTGQLMNRIPFAATKIDRWSIPLAWCDDETLLIPENGKNEIRPYRLSLV